ncbi:hypothetical protein HUW51_20510 [Adhaeribacter swui]|uniref:Uncharacterized protein n=1 Tax=Adhaeribacter swui TaxID=2086471 RepID=A0A7G7GCV2_9BACT|nr:hypothetical protein [Adhaeribacter swui]QNF34986.1 hypothetical protein HUW51_20510 [Adhaeribacter swui]
MKASILRILNKILKETHLQVRGRQQIAAENKYISFLESLVLNSNPEHFQHNLEEPLSVELIIFSKDRAMQLYALLESIIYNFSEPIKTHILYRSSSDQQEKSYQEVRKCVAGHNFNFVKEQSFRQDLIQLIQNIKSTKIFFLVDDIVFTEPLNIRDFVSINTNQYVASLRLGKHLNFCYTLQKEQPLPLFFQEKEAGIADDKIYWNWDEGTLDWHYPLSVDGHLFSTFEIKSMLPLMNFKAPNSLEEEMQTFAPLYLKRKGVAYWKAKILNIPCNKVQEENNNISAEEDVAYFLKKWNEGYQIDFLKLQHFVNTSVHQYVALEYVERKQDKVNIINSKIDR